MFITLIKKRKKEIINLNYGWSYSKERKSKFNFLKHNEFDTERKIENKNPFEYDKSASTLKCNETDYKIFVSITFSAYSLKNSSANLPLTIT